MTWAKMDPVRRPWYSRTSRRPDILLAMKEVDGFLDLGKPVGLIMNAVIHHMLTRRTRTGSWTATSGRLPRAATSS